MINDIITAMEKECAVAEFQFDKANMLFEMVEKNHEMMYQEASVMVYANDRSYEDLCALYEAADAETTQKKGGILSSIFNAIASIASAIGNAIKKFFSSIKGKTDDDEVVQISKNDKMTLDLIDGYSNNSGKVLGGLTNLPFGKIIAAVAGAGATIGVGSALYKHVTKPKTDGTEDQDYVGVKKSVLMNGLEKVQNLISKIGPGSKKVADAASGDGSNTSDVTPEQQDSAKKNAGAMRTILEKLQGLASILMNKIFSKKETGSKTGQPDDKTSSNTDEQAPSASTNAKGESK